MLFSRNSIFYLLILSVIWAICPGVYGTSSNQNSRPRPPFRVLFSNDMTNISSCDSPYSPLGTPFNKEGLLGSIDETAGTGIDVHMFQPGLGRVPFWKSKIYPYEDHFAWYFKRYGIKPGSFDKYMLEGGDIVGDVVNRCHQQKLAPFISLRMNDHHRIDYVDLTKEEIAELGLRMPSSLSISKFYHDHPEYRLNDIFPVPPRGDMTRLEYIKKYESSLRANGVWNWAVPEVRKEKLDYFTEIAENYDISGIEMDFVRFPFFFKDEISISERKDIMTNFARKIRMALDETAKNGSRRWLAMRVPAWIDGVSGLNDCGFDIQRLYDAGVDIFNLACDYVTEQQTDLPNIRAMAPDAPLYLEFSHVNHRYRLTGQKAVYRTTTEQQFYTGAHIAYSQGAQGLSVFNFVYYRDHGERRPEDVSEPPFHIFKKLRDPAAVAREPQHYFLSRHDAKGRPVFMQQFGAHNVFPVAWHGTPALTKFSMYMAPPAGGWKSNGRLRIQLDRDWSDVDAIVSFNGQILKPARDVSEPYQPVKYTVGLGKPQELRAWIVPVKCLRNGINKIELKGPKRYEGRIIFIDLNVR